MQTLIFTNSKNQTFTLTYSAPYVLQDLLGLSTADAELLSTRGYKQDGQNAEGQFFNSRPVAFTVIILGDTFQEMYQNRRSLVKYFNPKDTFTVVYENDYISVKFSCRIDGAPSFTAEQSNETFTHQACAISLLCDDPYLYALKETKSGLSIIEPKFYFPIAFTANTIFSAYQNQRITLDNDGDVPTPVRIMFTGPALNPVVTNETTGEFIKINKQMADGETLEVRTAYGDKRVEIILSDQSRQNAYHYIDLSSTFFQLEVGENTIAYTADSGANTADVHVYWSQKYVGV